MLAYRNLKITVAELAIISLIIAVSLPVLAETGKNKNSLETFSLEIQDESLEKACKKLSELSTYEITVKNKLQTELPKVSLKIEKGSVFMALHKMLRSQNYAIVSDDEQKKIVIWLTDHSNLPDQAFSDMPPLNAKPKSLEELRAEVGAENIEVLPPSEPGGKGVTLSELESMEKKRNLEAMDPSKIEVLPPDKPEEKGKTLAEVQASLNKKKSEMDANKIEVLPPDKPGGKGVTLQEIRKIETKKDYGSQDIRQLLPPEEPNDN